MNHNPFKAGQPLLEQDATVYIERQADRDVLFHLQKMDYVQLISQGHQQGKTSLIHHLIRQLRDVAFVYIDVGGLGDSSEVTLSQTLCEPILDQLAISSDQQPAIPQENFSLRNFFSDLARRAMQEQRRVVIVLDEIDLGTFPDASNFFTVLRGIYSLRTFNEKFYNLSFLFAGTSYPADLSQDHGIPYNISQAVHLHDFTLTEVRELVSKGNWSEKQATTLAERIYYWTNGQPYLTQRLCSYLPVNATESDVDLSVERLRLEDAHNLPRIVARLKSEQEWQAEVARIMSGERIRFDRFVRHKPLSQLGVIKADQDRFCTIRNRIYRESLSIAYPALTPTPSTPTLTAADACDLAQRLNATLVEYFCDSPQQWSAFFATRTQTQRISLPFEHKFVKKIEQWITRMDNEDKEWPSIQEDKQGYEVLSKLHEMFIAPLKEYLPKKGSHLILAPFGALHLWPLHAAFDSERYLSQDYMITFTPTLSALRDAYEQAAAKPSRFAPLRLLNVAYPGEDGSYTYLDNVVESARKIAGDLAQVTELYNADATPEAVIKHAPHKDAIHFFCHGKFDPDTPERSGLLLSGGYLTAQRIIKQMNLTHTQLVTLGTCRAGLANVHLGDQLEGFIEALINAKAQAVVAGLWAVREKPTVALFEEFYGQIAKGRSAVEALHLATQHIRKQAKWQHPYYWAAFQVSGLAYQRDKREFVTKALSLLEKINESRDELLKKFDATKQEDISEKMRKLIEEPARVQNEEELLAFCENIYRFVNKTPELQYLVNETPEPQDLLPAHSSDGPKMISPEDVASAGQDDENEKWVLEHAPRVPNKLLPPRDRETSDHPSPNPIPPVDRRSWFPPSFISLLRKIGL